MNTNFVNLSDIITPSVLLGGGSKPKLILFYADWCSHCIKFKPIWEKFIPLVDTTKITISSTNKDEDYAKYKITSFPTIKLFIDGQEIPFTEKRTIDNLLNFVNHHLKTNILKGGMEHRISLSVTYLSLIASGQKIYEGRLGKSKFRDIAVNDVVIWYNGSEEVKTKVVNILHFASFKDAIDKVGLSKILPNVNTISEGINVYRQFYSEEDERKYGVLLFELEVIKN